MSVQTFKALLSKYILKHIWVVAVFLTHLDNVQSQGRETLVKERVSNLVQLHRPEKLTVGPDDNFQVDVSSEEDFFVFTRRSHLSTRLLWQAVSSSKEIKILDDSADASNPSLHPNNKSLAFIYYKWDSQGDLCTLNNLSSKEPKCYGLKGEIESPQWLNSNDIVFIQKEFPNNNVSLNILNTKTQTTKVVDRGDIWSPTVNRALQYLTYSKVENKTTKLILMDLKNRRTVSIQFEMPGTSAFPTFSPDGNWLYFSHYFSDSNQDNQIDASDNSIIFRASTKELFVHKKAHPYQMTSGEQNCSFPKVQFQFFYMTCDFEGSLDVYRLPTTGVVPTNWESKDLYAAHRSSRNYNQRILLLNHLRQKGEFKTETSYYLKVLSNFLLNEDWIAAQYYLDFIPQKDRDILSVFITATLLRSKEQNSEITPNLMRNLNPLLNKVRRNPNLGNSVVEALILTYLNQDSSALNRIPKIKSVDFSGSIPYLYDLLINTLNSKIRISSSKLFELYRPILLAENINKESRLYYAYNYLQHLQNSHMANARLNIIKEQRPLLKKFLYLSQLLRSEELVLKLIIAKDKESKVQIYKDLDNLMSESRDDYFLRRTLYVRAIENLLAYNENLYLTSIAANWLKYTGETDPEFYYAREIYIDKVLERAYDNFAKSEINYAANNFFSSVGLTDDLESHYGYVKTMILNNNKSIMESRYRSMQERNVVGESLQYVQTLLSISQYLPDFSMSENGQGKESINSLNKVYIKSLANLKKMEAHYQSPIYQLLLGFVHLQLLDLSRNGFEFSQDHSDSAHKHLMLAYDLGRDSPRIRASALSNLASLHSLSRNWGLAKRFYEMRAPLGFIKKSEEFSHYWGYARAAYHLMDYQTSIESLQKLYAQKKIFSNREALILQKLSFYQLAAEQYENAETNFSFYLANYPSETLWNRTKSELALGYARYKLLKHHEFNAEKKQKLKLAAESNFTNVIQQSLQIENISDENKKLIPQNPNRLRMQALGFLSQIVDSDQRVIYRQKYSQIIKSAERQLHEFSISKNTWLLFKIKSEVGLAESYLESSDIDLAKQHLKEASRNLRTYVKTEDFALNTDLNEALISWVGLAIRANDSGVEAKNIESLYQGALGEIHKVQAQSPHLEFEGLRLRVFKHLLQKKLLAKKPDEDRLVLLEKLKSFKSSSNSEKALGLSRIL